jgi:hypothetical protein
LGWLATEHASQIANDLLSPSAGVIQLIDLVSDGLKVLSSGLLCVIAGRRVTPRYRSQLLHANPPFPALRREDAAPDIREAYERLSRRL